MSCSALAFFGSSALASSEARHSDTAWRRRSSEPMTYSFTAEERGTRADNHLDRSRSCCPKVKRTIGELLKLTLCQIVATIFDSSASQPFSEGAVGILGRFKVQNSETVELRPSLTCWWLILATSRTEILPQRRHADNTHAMVRWTTCSCCRGARMREVLAKHCGDPSRFR